MLAGSFNSWGTNSLGYWVQNTNAQGVYTTSVQLSAGTHYYVIGRYKTAIVDCGELPQQCGPRCVTARYQGMRHQYS